MRIVQIATSLVGGAGVAALRLNDALNEIGVKSTLISIKANKDVYKPDIIISDRSQIKSFTSKALTFAQQKIVQSGDDLVTPFSLSTLSLDEIFKLEPDIVHLHSFYNLLSTKDIEKLVESGISIFITLHDERILTGGCHCTNGCSNFHTKCEKCPQSKMLFRSAIKKEKFNWLNIFEKENHITLICPSKWIADQVKKAGLNPSVHYEIIRNPISSMYLNQKIYERHKETDSPFIVTFISQDLQNSYKGIDGILECISMYSSELKRKNISFRFVGNGLKLKIKGVQFRQYPNLRERDLIEIYKSTDLLLVPSKTDNSPNVIFEAAMCGTPFLGSNKAGLPELSELFGSSTFEYGNPESLYNAIVEAKNTIISSLNIRNLALENVDPQTIAETLKQIYQRKLTESASRRSSKDA
jgi:glycosyltransferase involved in cell wall biosynthesis